MRYHGLVFLLTLGICAQASAASITIGSTNRQRITGWGICTNNRPDWGAAWVISRNPVACDAAYGQLGATHLRIDLACTSFGVGGIYTDSTRLGALRKHILAATSRGMSYFISLWSPPAEMKNPASTAGSVNGVDTHLRTDMEDIFVQRMTESVNWLVANGCPMPAALSFQNEPDWNPWYEGCVYAADQYQRVAKKFRVYFDAHGLSSLRLHLCDAGYEIPEMTLLGNASGDCNALDADPDLNRAASILSVHTYDMHNGQCMQWNPGILQRYSNAMRGRSQEQWMTEYSPMEVAVENSWQGLFNTVRHFNRDMTSLGFNLWSHFQVWSADSTGLMVAGTSAITKTPWFYVFNRIWANVLPGSYVRGTATDDPDLLADALTNCAEDVSAFSVSSGKMVVVVTNPTAVTKTLDIRGLSGTRATLLRMDSSSAVNTDMTAAGTYAVTNGTVSGLVFPRNTISVIVTQGSTANADRLPVRRARNTTKDDGRISLIGISGRRAAVCVAGARRHNLGAGVYWVIGRVRDGAACRFSVYGESAADRGLAR